MHIKGVFFDLYGTLLMYGNVMAAWAEWQQAFYECLEDCGLTLSKESFILLSDGFFERPEPQFHDEHLTVLERRIKAFCFELGLALRKEELQQTAVAIVNAWQHYVSLDPDALPVLQALKSKKSLALISNFDYPPYIYSMLSELGLMEFFDTIVISGNVGIKKPDPRIFYFALQQTKLQPRQVVYVGDSSVDVQGAQAAGLCPIRIQRCDLDENYAFVDLKMNQESPPRIINASPDAVRTISKLSEIIELIQ